MSTITQCGICGADETHLMALDDGLVYCDVHRGSAAALGATATVLDPIAPVPPTIPAPDTEIPPDVESSNGAEPATDIGPAQVVDIGTDYEGDDEGPPIGYRMGIVTAACILFEIFDYDCDDLTRVLKNGPDSIAPDKDNADVVLRAGVALGLATWLDVFDIEPIEIEAMRDTLLSLGDTTEGNTK